MFPSDWGDKKGIAPCKRRKVSSKDENKKANSKINKKHSEHIADTSGCIVSVIKEIENDAILSNDSILPNRYNNNCIHGVKSYTNEKDHELFEDLLPSEGCYDSILNIVKRQVNNTRFAPATPEELQLDHVLSSVPYQSMLESLFGGVTEHAATIPIVAKAYEESFMREAMTGERQCAMGELCECMFIDKNAPFVGVEFVIGDVSVKNETSEKRNITETYSRMCVLCYRKTTQKLFYDMCYSGRRIHGVIQHYGNMCNQPGEYARSCMLICPPSTQWNCMPLPIMSHQRNRYRVYIVAGMKHLQQLRVSYEEYLDYNVGANVDENTTSKQGKASHF